MPMFYLVGGYVLVWFFMPKEKIALTFPRIIAAVSLCGVWLTF
jgi:hypothetical protein